MSPTYPLRFGIHCIHEACSFPDLVAFWQQIEALGYDWLSVIDHMYATWAPLEDGVYEATATLAAAAAGTRRVRLGSFTLCNGFRHPAVLAKTLATVDQIAGGRLEPGFGAGWNAAEHAAYGLEFPAPAERVRRLDEALAVVRALWTEERATFEGRYYAVRDAVCAPKPLQHPSPPIWVGGSGEQLMLKVVARRADGWNIGHPMPPEVYRRKVDTLARYCAEVGRDPAEIRRSFAVIVIAAETDAKAHDLAARLDSYLRAPLRPDQCIVGGPETCAARLLEYVRLGVTDIAVRTLPRPLGAQLAENFLTRVAPRIREGAA